MASDEKTLYTFHMFSQPDTVKYEWKLKASVPILNNGGYLKYSFKTICLIWLGCAIILPLVVLVFSQNIALAVLTLIVVILGFGIALVIGGAFLLERQFLEGGVKADVYLTDDGLICDIYNTRGRFRDYADRSSLTWWDLDLITIDRAKNTIEIQSRALKEQTIDIFPEPEDMDKIAGFIKQHAKDKRIIDKRNFQES